MELQLDRRENESIQNVIDKSCGFEWKRNLLGTYWEVSFKQKEKFLRNAKSLNEIPEDEKRGQSCKFLSGKAE